MELKFIKKDENAILEISGEMDSYTLKKLRSMLKDLPEDIKTLYFDMEKVSFVDSETLSFLIDFHHTSRKKKTRIVLVHLTPQIFRLITAAGLDRLFHIEESLPGHLNQA